MEFTLELKEKHVRETTEFMSNDCAIGKMVQEKFEEECHIGYYTLRKNDEVFYFTPSYYEKDFKKDRSELTGDDERVIREYEFVTK